MRSFHYQCAGQTIIQTAGGTACPSASSEHPEDCEFPIGRGMVNAADIAIAGAKRYFLYIPAGGVSEHFIRMNPPVHVFLRVVRTLFETLPETP